MIEEALDYDEFEVDSDNDTVDAFGIALMKAIDMDNQVPINEDELLAHDPYKYPEWGERNGNVINSAMVNEMNSKEKLGVTEDFFSRYARQQLNEEDDSAEDFGKGDFYQL